MCLYIVTKHICDKHQPFSHGLVKMLNNTEESLYNATHILGRPNFQRSKFWCAFHQAIFHTMEDMEWFISRQLTANLLCVKNDTVAIFLILFYE